ncbi:MAG: hypothetical protein WCP96_00445 [Methylococcaceae bacterium]
MTDRHGYGTYFNPMGDDLQLGHALNSFVLFLATNLRRDTEQQNDSLSAKNSVIPAGMPESSHTDVKL